MIIYIIFFIFPKNIYSYEYGNFQIINNHNIASHDQSFLGLYSYSSIGLFSNIFYPPITCLSSTWIISNSLYVFGGGYNIHYPYNNEHEGKTYSFNNVFEYSLGRNEWRIINGEEEEGEKMNEMYVYNENNHPRGMSGSAGFVTMNNTLMLIGGFDNIRTFYDIWEYNIDKQPYGQWRKVYETYCVDKMDSQTCENNWYSDVNNVYNESNHPMPFFNVGNQFFQLNNNEYIIYIGSRSFVDTVTQIWVYHFVENKWKALYGTDLEINDPGLYQSNAGVCLNDKDYHPPSRSGNIHWFYRPKQQLYIYGGAIIREVSSSMEYFSKSDMWRYDVKNNSWCFMHGNSGENNDQIVIEENTYNINNLPGFKFLSSYWSDEENGLFYMFAGVNTKPSSTNPIGNGGNDVWVFSVLHNMFKPTEGKFDNTPEYGIPNPRSGSNVFYNSDLKRVIIYAGNLHNENQYYSDMWEYKKSERLCFGLDFQGRYVCNQFGECLEQDNCSCFVNFDGEKCENIKKVVLCDGIENFKMKEVCNGNGICIDNEICECRNDYFGEFCKNGPKICNGYRHNHPLTCNNNGKCVDFNKCLCDEFYKGKWCETYKNITLQKIFIGLSISISSGSCCFVMLICICLVMMMYIKKKSKSISNNNNNDDDTQVENDVEMKKSKTIDFATPPPPVDDFLGVPKISKFGKAVTKFPIWKANNEEGEESDNISKLSSIIEEIKKDKEKIEIENKKAEEIENKKRKAEKEKEKAKNCKIDDDDDDDDISQYMTGSSDDEDENEIEKLEQV